MYELFKSAQREYLLAVGNRMKPECFLELFEQGNYHINCDLPQCKNAHLMMLGIIKNLFTNKNTLAVIESKNEFSPHKLVDLYLKYAALDKTGVQKEANRLTFGCNLTERQIDILVDIIHSHAIFSIPEGCNIRNVLSSLFNCKSRTPIYVKNVRNAATLFDAMAQCRIINSNWQHVVENGRFLKKALTDKLDNCITATCLSSSLSRTRKRNTMTASQYAIRNAVAQMLKEE